MEMLSIAQYKHVVNEIAALDWESLGHADLMAVAMAYYYFSVQFRENLEVACEMRPWDESLAQLRGGECDTDNLSPYPGIANPGERMNHDEFMRRILPALELNGETESRITACGMAYLAEIRAMDNAARAASISSYEDGGLETVFNAMLRAPAWDHVALRAFEHFLVGHIEFDSAENGGHGALARHIVPDDNVVPLWDMFKHMLLTAAPALTR